MAGDLVRQRPAGVSAAQAHLQAGQVEGVEDQLDTAADQGGVDLVAVAVQAHQGGLGHGAVLRPQERLGQIGRDRDGEGAAGHPPGQGRLSGLGVHAAVVDALHPGGEQPVQLGQVGEVVAGCAVGGGDLDHELAVDTAEEAFDLAATLGSARGGVHQLDAQLGAGPQQPRVHKRRAVVDVDPAGDATGRQCRPQRGGQPHGVLGIPPPVPDDRPGMVVDEAEQVGLAPGDAGPVQRIPGPQLVGVVGFEAAEACRPGWRGGKGRQARAQEHPLQGALVWGPAQLGGEDAADLRRRPIGVFGLERRRQLQHLGGGARLRLAGAGD
jgi:hypothetical protein